MEFDPENDYGPVTTIQFDPAKDETNQSKHGVYLSRSADLQILSVKRDERFDYGEDRYRA